ncbi:MAG: winged helix-turn-helix domain-containing protein [Gammaproteobacteria bacterium]|nr:winged helix-turn-helix domain-containing protein [Gammaproteobacteria bacterium]
MSTSFSENTATHNPELPFREPIRNEPLLLSEDFIVGDWIVRPMLNQLQHRHTGMVRHLEPRLVTLLCCLAAQPRQLVDRESLVNTLWPSVIVNENSLTRAISELRKQLVASGQLHQIYIETIPKRGYRLCLSVNLVESALDSSAKLSKNKSSRAFTLHSAHSLVSLYDRIRRPLLAVCCLCLVMTGWLSLDNSFSVKESPSDRFNFADETVPWDEKNLADKLVPTSAMFSMEQLGNFEHPVLSQDQTRFAYIRYAENGSTLFIGEVGNDDAPIPVFISTDIMSNLTWSPLGSALLFASRSTVTNAALFGGALDPEAGLYSFDLETFRVSKLVERSPDVNSTVKTSDHNLT